jgi:uncharacterized membrane protein YfcA
MILYFLSLLVLGAIAAFFSGLLGIGGGIFYVPGLDEFFIKVGILPAMSMHLALGTSTCSGQTLDADADHWGVFRGVCRGVFTS